MNLSRQTNSVLIAGITPYFLKKGNVWFEKNLKKLLKVRKTQTFFDQNITFIEKDQKCNFSQILRKLDEMGYEKVYQVSEIGEFAQRGGIIDVFPINSNCAFRLDFLGNKVEAIEELTVKIKKEAQVKERLKKKLKSQKLFSDLKNIKGGDYLVHLDHGIGRFIKKDILAGYPKPESAVSYEVGNLPPTRYYILQYAAGDKLYVPQGLERKLSRYVGFIEPKISRLDSSLWQKTKRKVKEQALKLAKELLAIYAQREIVERPLYLPEDEFDRQLASSFLYQETPDQTKAIREIKQDLEKRKPMDRVLCGDVGFGKTEVALRAMIRVVKSGYQVAMLCPTTILANQHLHSFLERTKNLPIKIALLSRLQSKKEQREIVEKVKLGKIDFLVGTHRILSKDVIFNNLGLLIIDDEQRFGVRQKEKFKKMRAEIDILSLSATPIPRTLYLSLSSLRDISLIRTPPQGRLPVKTWVKPFSEKIIKEAIKNEMSRAGQVYYLHNRVETIVAAEKFLQSLLPKVKFGVAHGKLTEKALIGVMNDFQRKKVDVLIATTIIENGLDLPNVNTLIVDDATRLGLAQSYQIRGRVGRSHTQALAFFLYGSKLTPKGKMRLKALKEAESLGSGYRVALKDLEIRGAGNILGREQSGSINRVGLNLYCQMLSQAILRLRQEGSEKKDS